ncbi:hypothetical protein NP142_14270 [Salmonella enterica]|uniref:hypothetical protein n=1 Tax=Salmonella TaxID=590 RepID=UPI000B618855|nr:MULTISPECIES: hypothetical protein [Salmonella]ASN57528.1 hypothetical protein CGL53_18495 [Salmonella enterica subsp. enterica serovar Indiana]EEJ2275961.1 hypothetical protein [Salmonella enterica subsp. enterica]MBJ5712945.1 hypothetical protein [Salmonella enterica subsp. enterica serovar Indiana]MBJ6087370.1 hypothetical protein [Salmonella enterica subsp. enterica serovar Indiana]MBM8358764.1 hypothetical protein [Salmonella enterica]
MNNFSVSVIKVILSSISALTAFLCFFLITLIFSMWAQDGMPPFENIKFSVALFFVILMLLSVCVCLKFFMDMAIDSRNYSHIKNNKTDKRRVDEVIM